MDRASALSYEVKEDEYIQIIDVRGRQCSDFLAFNAEKLQQGVERGLDAQVTRTLMGRAYPVVGLHSKYYDLDMDPLCQIVQDTVGRHDSFALACTRKYYDDMGYFGHVNCTENFNAQLDPFAIAPRKGWEALNFFYNTGFDDDHVLFLDEPWSRPGDFVLLRALNDLVCASSACPDDIDPANGWETTDVHVRVYSPENRFQMAIAHRVTPDAEPVMTKETGFHSRWSELTRNVTEYRGYWLPTCFTNQGAVQEYWACREKAVVMDLSPLRKWEVLGPDAEALIQATITRDARRLAVGQVVYTAVCNETGGMIDDATVFRMADDNFRFIGGDPYTGVHLKKVAEERDLRVWVKPSTDELHNIAVQGPRSREILKEFVWAPPTQPQLEELKWFRFLVGRIGTSTASRSSSPARATAASSATRSSATRRRRGGLGRGHGRGRAEGHDPARPRRARHAAHRGRPDLRRLRVRRPGRPVRGRRRLHGEPGHRGGLRRQGGAARAQGASAAHARRARARGQRDRGPRRLRARRAALASASSPPGRAARRCARTSRCAGCRSPTPRPARRSRSASSTATRSGSPRRWCRSRSTTRTRRARAPDESVDPRPPAGVRLPAELHRS